MRITAELDAAAYAFEICGHQLRCIKSRDQTLVRVGEIYDATILGNCQLREALVLRPMKEAQ